MAHYVIRRRDSWILRWIALVLAANVVASVTGNLDNDCEFVEVTNPYFHSMESLLDIQQILKKGPPALEHLGLRINTNDDIKTNWNAYNNWLLQQKNNQVNDPSNYTYEYKTFYFIRHGQALHNIDPSGSLVLDPPLTQSGIAQSIHLSKYVLSAIKDYGMQIDLIMTSPLQRALQTINYMLPILNTTNNNIPIYAHELIRETLNGFTVASKRRNLHTIQAQFSYVNFSRFIHSVVDDYWEESRIEVGAQMIFRLDMFLNGMFDVFNDFNNIIISTHSGVISTIVRILTKKLHTNYKTKNNQVIPICIARKCKIAKPVLTNIKTVTDTNNNITSFYYTSYDIVMITIIFMLGCIVISRIVANKFIN